MNCNGPKSQRIKIEMIAHMIEAESCNLLVRIENIEKSEGIAM